MHVIPGPLPEAVAGIDELPGLAAIVGAVQAAIGVARLDDGVDAIGVGRDGNADASVRAFGQAVFFEALPGRATVGRAVESAAGAAVGHAPRSATSLPERREQNIGIAGVEGHVDASGILIFVEDLLPILAAVGCAENAALGVRPIGMAEGCDESDVGIVGIDNDLADGAAVAQANVLPGLARVEGFVDSIAVRNVAAYAGFAGADVNSIVIGIGDGQAANRSASLFIEDRRPGLSAVGGLPHTAARHAEIVGRGIARDSGSGQRATATKGTDQAILHALERLFLRLGGLGRCGFGGVLLRCRGGWRAHV